MILRKLFTQTFYFKAACRQIQLFNTNNKQNKNKKNQNKGPDNFEKDYNDTQKFIGNFVSGLTLEYLGKIHRGL